MKKTVLFLMMCVIACDSRALAAEAKPDQPRVFITDSQSWETYGYSWFHGSGSSVNGTGSFSQNGGSISRGGARPQTAEIIKTFGERCPQTTANNIVEKADYVVVLDHEGGKGLLRHKNKIAVFNRISGDAIVSHSTLSLGGSVQEGCAAIVKDWAEHGAAIRAAANAAVQNKALANSIAKLLVASIPDGADIEIDGAFAGNTPSTLDLAPGEHTVSVKKSGYSTWERKVKLTGGDIRLNAELQKAQ